MFSPYNEYRPADIILSSKAGKQTIDGRTFLSWKVPLQLFQGRQLRFSLNEKHFF